MYQINDFAQRADLDNALASNVAELLSSAISQNGKASLEQLSILHQNFQILIGKM